jgi:hypothetical protein
MSLDEAERPNWEKRRATEKARRQRRERTRSRIIMLVVGAVAISAAAWLALQFQQNGGTFLHRQTAEQIVDEWVDRLQPMADLTEADRTANMLRQIDAYRIMQNAAGRISELRIAEARQDSHGASVLRDELEGDRNEWDSLVASKLPKARAGKKGATNGGTDGSDFLRQFKIWALAPRR